MRTKTLKENIAENSRTGLKESLSKKNNVHKTVYWVTPNTRKNGFIGQEQEWMVANKYKGDWKDNKRSGFGIHTYLNGNIYEGKFSEGKREGEGTLLHLRHGKLTREYTGFWFNNKKEGKGNAYFMNGDKYDGYWKEDKMEGFGKMDYAGGDTYIGLWNNNKRNGYGLMTYANGDNFEGLWINNKKEGYGSYFFSNQNTLLIGEWADDIHSTGVYAQTSQLTENELYLPIICIENPEEMICENIEKFRFKRKLVRVKQLPVGLMFESCDSEELSRIFSEGIRKGRTFENIKSIIFEVCEEITGDELNEVISQLEIDITSFSEEDFIRIIYYLILS